jgi:hypothetical protein
MSYETDYDLEGGRFPKDVGIRFKEELEFMDKALYAAYRRGAKDAGNVVVREAQRIALREGVNFLDLKLGFLLSEALDAEETGTEQ